MTALTLSFHLCFTIFLLIACTASSVPPETRTRNGTYQGVHIPTFNQDFWGGIPYSQTPERLSPALSLNTSFEGVRTASNFSVGCVGFGGDDTGLPLGEDCLTINIIRPSGTTPSSKLPVTVWIYGKFSLQARISILTS